MDSQSNDALLQAAMSVWPFSPREPLAMGVECGVVWATALSPMGTVNGYALIPAEGHPWSAGVPIHGGDWEEYESERVLQVHGGITYGKGGPWIGFDCMHAWDVWPAEFDRYGVSFAMGDGNDRFWTPELVAEEAKSLARQIAAVGR